jgi:hypothetical protein
MIDAPGNAGGEDAQVIVPARTGARGKRNWAWRWLAKKRIAFVRVV